MRAKRLLLQPITPRENIVTDTYEQDQKTSRECINLAIAVMRIGGEGHEDAAWSVARSDPLLNPEATKEAWLSWAREMIAKRERAMLSPKPPAPTRVMGLEAYLKGAR
jgi:hypothetical protein